MFQNKKFNLPKSIIETPFDDKIYPIYNTEIERIKAINYEKITKEMNEKKKYEKEKKLKKLKSKKIRNITKIKRKRKRGNDKRK